VKDSNSPRSETRSNAVWGSGAGETRSNAMWGRSGRRANALWGRSGRGLVLGIVAALTIAVPLGATAGTKGKSSSGNPTFIAPGLLDGAKNNPNQKLHVIIQSSAGVADATKKIKGLGATVRKQLNLIGAVAVDITARKLASLSKQTGLTITADAPVRLSGSINYSTQMWPYASGVALGWGYPLASAPQAPTIAIVDSGIDPNRADFDNGARVLPQVNLASLTPNSPGDGRGHGTFVAAVAAGSGPGFAGAAPNARILPIDVMDDTGKALTSDVIAACQYILQNKSALNIRVANFSLHSGAQNHFYNDPLDRAVEKLWFSGVFVVAAAGNYGSASGPSGVLNAPGNDPFVMTVGALDLGSSFSRSDDSIAPWSAWGYTEDGFSKPEISAPGRYMIAAVPPSATLTSERPDHVVAPGYMQLSGTSFASPVVAGAAAQLLARHPSWTPDQVKGALMLTAAPLSAGTRAGGVGELNQARALGVSNPPNPNSGLVPFEVSDPLGGLVFNSASWVNMVTSNPSWTDASWGDASWGDASWVTASWGDASWSAASWADASWGDASWADASWADTSSEDGVEGESGGVAPAMDAAAAAALQSSSLALPAGQEASDPVVP
jgi:serine protease AprX